MALWRYRALDARGQRVDGQMQAASREEVALRLQEQGYLPIEASPAQRAGTEGLAARWARGFKRAPLSGPQQVQFTRQLATLLGAGQPLDRALGLLLELPDDAAGQRVLADVREAVRGGASLSAALERQHGLFSPLYLSMVRAGEAGGQLDVALKRLGDYLEGSRQLRGRVLNALIYPVILLLVVGGALGFLLGYVVPEFASMYASLDAELAWFTRWVLGLGELVRTGWWLLLAALLGALWWFERRLRRPALRTEVDGWLLRQRVIGSLLARLDTARLARTLGTLIASGVPLLSALDIAKSVLGNRVLLGEIEAAADAVRNGKRFSEALAAGGQFPRLAVQMVQVGEESGALDGMLLNIAETFEYDTAQTLERLLAALVPVMTVVLAVLVGVVVLAVLVPIYGLTNAL